MRSSSGPVLVGDIGGTHARFALVDEEGRLGPVEVVACDEHADAAAAVEAGLRALTPKERPERAALAVAAPVLGDQVDLTNLSWSFSVRALQQELSLGELKVLNDYAALALALPSLGPGELERVKEGESEVGATLALLGPGTGLGVSALVPCGGGWTALQGEGGHVDLAAADEGEWRALRALQARCGHVSAERVLSGPGLALLFEVLCEQAGRHGEKATAEQVSEKARRGEDPEAEAVLRLFASWLGAVAGDLVLTLGARGGAYLGGGILPRLGGLFRRDLFRDRFLAKGRFRRYLEKVPVDRILEPEAATLRGAASSLAASSGGR